MARFDLVFQGDLLPGHRYESTVEQFARLFGIADRSRAEVFFVAKPVTLRRRLGKHEAAGLYVRLRRIGMRVELRPSEPGAGEISHPVEAEPLSGAPRPNLFALIPGQGDVERPLRARQLAQAALGFAALTAGILLVLGMVYWRLPPPAPPPTVHGAAVSDRGALWLATDNSLLRHDRSGAEEEIMALEEFRIRSPVIALKAGSPGTLWLLTGTAQGERELHHCRTAPPGCTAILAGDLRAMHWLPRPEQLVVAHGSGLQLLAATGQPIATHSRAVGASPHLQEHEGLLLMSSHQGPALSVLRREPAHFGEQLDELLLLPPGALEDGLDRSGPFVWSGNSWWVALTDTSGERQGLYRFDGQWQYQAAIPLPGDTRVDALLRWGERILVVDYRRDALLRFTAEGSPLAPLPLTALQKQRETLGRQANRQSRWWRGSLLGLGGLASLAALLALWQSLRDRVFRNLSIPSAGPLPPPDSLHWLPADARRSPRLLLLIRGLAAIAVISVALSTWAGVDSTVLAGLLLVLSGPALGLWLLVRMPPGLVAQRGKHLVLVDHRGIYQQGSGRQAAWHPHFLAIGDLLVYTGHPWLPALDCEARRRELGISLNQAERLGPLTLAVLLLENRHPLGIAALLLVAFSVAGVALWLSV